jgi:hypothetical protein
MTTRRIAATLGLLGGVLAGLWLAPALAVRVDAAGQCEVRPRVNGILGTWQTVDPARYPEFCGPITTATATAIPTRTPTATATPPATAGTWNITVYYTAVESFHTDAPVAVTGCPTIQGARCGQALGSWPQSFVRAVKAEGTGRLNDGRYLNWSVDTGYWLDTAPRGSYGNVLIPMQSSAADGVPRGTAFRVLTCGTDSASGDPVDAGWCATLKAATWVMDDEFTPGLGGVRHVDLYIGEEDRAGFVRQSPKVIDTAGATLSIP